jgi:hypothetical protein
MSIQFETSTEGTLLRGRAWGQDDGLEEVKRYGMAIITACLEGGCDRTLLDERELKYNLSITDTFELAKFYSEQIYKLLPQIIQTAIVCDEEFIKDAAFWEDCAVNRGLYVKVFTSLEMAKRWLDDGG